LRNPLRLDPGNGGFGFVDHFNVEIFARYRLYSTCSHRMGCDRRRAPAEAHRRPVRALGKYPPYAVDRRARRDAIPSFFGCESSGAKRRRPRV